MADESAVLDAGVDVDFGAEPTESTESTETSSAATAGTPPEAKPQADEYKDDKSYRSALKAWRDANKDNPEIVKVARRAYELNGRFAEISKLDPKGVDGVRETYALVQNAGGPEKIVEMQQTLATYTATDAKIAAGDKTVLEAFGPEFDKGLARIAPAYLDRIQKSDPEAYASAILPHLMTNLKGSPLVGYFNAMIDDVQAEGVDDKGKIANIMKRLQGLSEWYSKQEAKVGEIRKGWEAPAAPDELQQRMSAQDKREHDFFWDTQVSPPIVQYENQALEKAFAPFQAKLKLPDAAKKVLFQDFKAGLKAAGQGDKTYIDTLTLFRNTKNPDVTKVQTHVKGGIDKHVAAVVKAATEARYGHVINSRPGPKTGTGESRLGVVPGSGAGTKANPLIVPTKPANESIDWQATKRHGDIYKKVYVRTDGKFVRWNRK